MQSNGEVQVVGVGDYTITVAWDVQASGKWPIIEHRFGSLAEREAFEIGITEAREMGRRVGDCGCEFLILPRNPSPEELEAMMTELGRITEQTFDTED